MKRWMLMMGALASLGGCAESSNTPTYVTIGLPQVTCPEKNPDALVLTDYEACSFSVSVLDGAWYDTRPESVFDSGCVPYSGDLVTISGFPAGSGRTIALKAYRDGACKDPVLTGIRGGVNIPEGESDGGIWYIPTFLDGGFAAFPRFGHLTIQAAEATACTTDADCRAQTGGAYVVSPVATCDTAAGHCVMPASTYPLNMGGPRAFHTATTLEDGRILLVGGFAREADTGKFIATDETVELFDPVSMTWSRPIINGLSGLRMGGHSTVALGGGRFGVFGGARQINLAIKGAGAGSKKYLSILVPSEDVTKTDNILDLAFTADLSTHAATVGTLSAPRVGARAVKVAGGVLVIGGLEPVTTGTGSVASVFVDLCKADGSPACKTTDPLLAGRFGHCAICEKERNGACDELLIFGGLSPQQTDEAQNMVAERWSGGAFEPIALFQSDIDGNVTWPVCARSKGKDYLVAGSAALNKAPAMLPSLLTLTESGAKIGAIALKDAGGTVSPFRTQAVATVLDDGRILVTGGVDDNGEPVRSAYIISADTIVQQTNMAIARFGHTATLITRGAFRGAVLIVGGFTVKDGTIQAVRTAELFIP